MHLGNVYLEEIDNMVKKINVTIENKLEIEKRDMNVYHHFTRSAHMISYSSSITLPFRSVMEDDYLHISIVSGPGPLEGKCMVNLPSWMDFEFSPGGDVAVSHSGNRTLLRIPPGPPVWQLKMTRQSSAIVKQSADYIIVGDDRQEYI
jgi:hypothetical protein